jgi:hypothetical protein
MTMRNLARTSAVCLLASLLACHAANAQNADASGAAPRMDRTQEVAPERGPQHPAAQAEASGVTARLTLAAPRGWQPGVAIEGRIKITLPEGARVEPPTLPPTMGVWDVRNARLEPSQQTGERTLAFSITAWESGDLALPPVPVNVVLQDGTRAELAVGPVDVHVETLLAKETDLTELAAPVRGPVDISTVRWWWIVGATLAAIVCMVLARMLFWRTRGAVTEPPLPPDAWALRELDRLDAERLPSRGDIDGFFARLSDIVRHYVEQRWGISAPEQTTKEFLRTARHHPELAGSHEHTLGGFLRTADMVKFAAVRPGDPECSSAMDSMRGFVRASAPVATMTPEQMAGEEPPPPLPPENPREVAR